MKPKLNRPHQYLFRIVRLGMILSFCFGVISPPAARAQAGTPGPGSLPLEGQPWSQSGWLSIIWADGQDGSSQETYTLADGSGRTTLLSLDETLARSLGGVLSFDRKYVSVQGGWTAAAHSATAYISLCQGRLTDTLVLSLQDASLSGTM